MDSGITSSLEPDDARAPAVDSAEPPVEESAFPSGRPQSPRSTAPAEPDWADAIGPAFRPERLPAAAWVRVGEHAVVTHDEAKQALTLDPVTAVLWESFDGTTTVRQLAEDLHEALGLEPAAAEAMVLTLVRVLALEGALVEPRLEQTLHRRWFPALVPGDCPSEKLGLEAATRIPVLLGTGEVIQITSTDDEIAAWLDGTIPPANRSDRDDGEIVGLNARPAADRSGKVGRPLARIVDHWGNLLWTSRNRVASASALGRYVSDRFAMTGPGTWFRSPLVLRDDIAIVVYRSFDDHYDQSRRALRDAGFTPYESAYWCFDAATGEAVIEPNPRRFPGDDDGELAVPGRYRVAQLVVPAATASSAPPRRDCVRGISHLAVRWDQPHLDAAAAMVETAEIVAAPPQISAAQFRSMLAGVHRATVTTGPPTS